MHEKGLGEERGNHFFLEDALKKVRELNDKVETGLIYAKHKNPLKAALELKANYLLLSTGSCIQLTLRKRMRTA